LDLPPLKVENMNNLYRKITIIAIIVLLIGSGVVPSIYANTEKVNSVKDFDKNQVDKESEIKLCFSFEEPRVIEKILCNETFSSISLQDLPLSRNPGKPLLPVKPVDVLLPPQSTIKNVCIDKEMKELEGEYLIEPSGKLVAIGEINNYDFENIFADYAVYNSSHLFPEKTYEIAGMGKFRGFSIVTVNLYPVQYIPKQGKLFYCTNITLIIETERKDNENNLCRSLSIDKELVKKMVVNPLMTDEYVLPTPMISNFESNSSSSRYVIITNGELKNIFEILIDHKSQYTTSNLFTVEEILNNSEYWVNGTWGDNNPENPYYDVDNPIPNHLYEMFNDTQAKIRNFIRYAHVVLETDYVLLGGDVEIIPHRFFYCGPRIDFDSGRPIYDNIPADLYYGALDWTWNRNYNEHFGEQEDDADFFAEVYIGRAPVSKEYGTHSYISKLKHFETTTKPKDITLHQSFIRAGNLPKSIKIPIECEKWIPENFTIHRLYQEYGEITLQDWFNSFTDGRFIIQHVGNGAFNTYCIDFINWLETWWGIPRTQELRNDFYPIHMSLACNAGKFDDECLAETFLTIDDGGASACIFNSREGIVTTYDAHAYSGEFMERQFYEIFQNETVSLGEVNQLAKQHFHGLAYSDPGYRWCYYTINLLGDPETPVLITRTKYQNETFVSKEFNSSTPGWGKTCFDNIQDAIDATEVNGIINVGAGTYYEAILINKPIHLICKDEDKATIDGSGSGNVITVDVPGIKIEGFEIRNSSIDGSGIMIDCTGNSSISSIAGNHISNCGIGICVNGLSNVDIRRCIVTNNLAWGLTLENSKNNIVIYCNISHNQYGGILLQNIYQSKLKRCNIEGNKIGIKISSNLNDEYTTKKEYGSLRINHNNFYNNTVHAFFINNLCHTWENNYWENPRSLPKLILGIIKLKGLSLIWPSFELDKYPEKQPNVVL